MQQKQLNQRYELEQKIGEGGMARVYRGRDLRLGRQVAIKVLHSQFAGDVNFLQRFHHEAQAAASLHHPAIVDIYDVGQDGEIHYIVMEYVDGSDLKRYLLQHAPLPVEQAVRIAAAVADGLAAAHLRGMVHRDIKPQNILIDQAGQVRITDFGIAKSALSTAMTETGMTFGTADYISPEQARGLPATPRSDVYSLGVTLYELLTGRLPFDGDSSVAVALKHVSEPPPPPRSFNPAIGLQLEALLLRTLSKNPDDRPASAAEFARLLRATLHIAEQPTVVSQQPRQNQAIVRPPAPPSNKRLSSNTGPVRLPPPTKSNPRPAANRGGGFGAFLLGLLLLGVILAGVYVIVTVPIDSVLAGVFPPRPTANVSLGVPTATPAPTVTAGPALLPAPNIVGMEERLAQSTLEQANMQPFPGQPRYSDTISVGLVIDQFPLAGTPISPTSVITYAVSLGPALTIVPDATMLSADNAERLLRERGFNVTRLEQANRDLPEGMVFRQIPAPGQRLKPGEMVTIVVSIGDKVIMPDVTGLQEQDAIKRLEAAGLTYSYSDYQGCDKLGDLCNNPRFSPGAVVSTEPRGKDLVDRGTPVTLGVRAR